ncbi:MAG TPA: hypothetical protein VIV60_04075, partial [Polyangiaceae bacterium]
MTLAIGADWRNHRPGSRRGATRSPSVCKRWIAALSSALIWACGNEPSEHVGGETNWLRVCASDADCPSSTATQACMCGICTKACANDACASDQVCQGAGDQATGAFCQSDEQQPICLPRCGSAACRSGSICVGQACV